MGWMVSHGSPAESRRDYVGFWEFLQSYIFSGSPGGIDKFFDHWLPVLTDEIRARIRGTDIARKMHQDTESQDVFSPGRKIGEIKLTSQQHNPVLERAIKEEEENNTISSEILGSGKEFEL